MNANDDARYPAEALTRFAADLLQAAGMAAQQAQAVAQTLIEGDLMGHDTHGLALLAPYVQELENGSMTPAGEPEVLSDRGPTALWDGKRLPGPWLVRQAIDIMAPRARQYGSATLVIRRSHHIACLAAYLLRATREGLLMMLASSDPEVASVAPHGGTRGVFTPNPIAVGIPATQSPFLVDISASIKTNGMTKRLHAAGQRYDDECLLDGGGRPSRDPGVLFAEPPGTILPLGGLAHGHKGYGLALAVEALTGGLAGLGRADPHEGWAATVFIALYDPDAFGGRDAFLRQSDWIAEACRNNPPRPGVDAVRMPGDRGIGLMQQQLTQGVRLHPTIAPMLADCAQRYGMAMPDPLG